MKVNFDQMTIKDYLVDGGTVDWFETRNVKYPFKFIQRKSYNEYTIQDGTIYDIELSLADIMELAGKFESVTIYYDICIELKIGDFDF